MREVGAGVQIEVQRYKNWSGTSGLRAYEIGPDFVRLKYASGEIYRYTDALAGRENVEEMKRLAVRGSHLNKFINQTPAIKNGFIRESDVRSPTFDFQEEET